jgi:hypothetical protein
MPAEPALLANIPRLMTAYCTTRPDPSRRRIQKEALAVIQNVIRDGES